MTDGMLLLSGVLASLVFGVHAQLNPLGRFGKCIDVPTVSDCGDDKVTWYLQYRPDNPDHWVHTCQAQYEQEVKGIRHSLLYFYNKGIMVKEPQHIKYKPVSGGKYSRKITVDDDTVVIYMNVLHYDPVLKYRVVYLCTDCEAANPDIFNVGIATLDQVPCNLDDVLEAGKCKLTSVSPCFDVKLMQVEQSLDKCKPLVVTTESCKQFNNE